VPPGSDPIASLRPWPIHIELGEQEYTIPALPALNWLEILLQNQVGATDIVPGLLLPDDELEVAERMGEGEITLQDIIDVSLEVIAIASGRTWWWTLQFCQALRGSWEPFYGEITLSGMNIDRIPLAAFLDAMYHLATRQLPEDKKALLDMELNTAPEGVEIPFDEDVEAEAFMRMMAQAQRPL